MNVGTGLPRTITMNRNDPRSWNGFKEKQNQTYATFETICIKCYQRNITVSPTYVLLKDLECENCGKGFIIKTGQWLEEEPDGGKKW